MRKFVFLISVFWIIIANIPSYAQTAVIQKILYKQE